MPCARFEEEPRCACFASPCSLINLDGPAVTKWLYTSTEPLGAGEGSVPFFYSLFVYAWLSFPLLQQHKGPGNLFLLQGASGLSRRCRRAAAPGSGLCLSFVKPQSSPGMLAQGLDAAGHGWARGRRCRLGARLPACRRARSPP